MKRAGPGLTVVLVLAAGLRLWCFSRTPPNPFYDAAVRSMGLSWHNLLFGAFDPTAATSVDKPPVDLWLQVASTKLFGFTSETLRLPQVLAGILSCGLVYDLVRRGFGMLAGTVAGLTLAVLPIAVVTSRSDTMDTLLGAVLLLALWVMVVAPSNRRGTAVVAAGALAGLAFEIKLFQAVVAVPALAVTAWLLLADTPAVRVRKLKQATAAGIGTAAAWPVLASLAPGHHPWPLGSSNGTIWETILIYNGFERLGTRSANAAPYPGIGPWRLFTTADPNHLAVIGTVLLPALLLGVAALHLRPDLRRRPDVVGIGTWLLTGFLLFSFQGRLQLRYLEAFSPAVAATFGASLVVVVRSGVLGRRAARSAVAVLGVAALLLVHPMKTSVDLVRTGAEDSQTLGRMPEQQLGALSAYLTAHRQGAHFQVAAIGSVVSGPLIVRDAQPVLLLSSWAGRPFTSPGRLDELVHAGAVRHMLMYAKNCREPTDKYCPPSARWALQHGVDVSAVAGVSPGWRLIALRPST